MKHWQNYSIAQRLQILDIASEHKGLPRLAVEKDWWVTMSLYALSKSRYAHLLSFKGGTSLSKGWQLIERFSEDIDISLKREDRFAISSASKTQLANVRRKSRHYVVRELPDEITEQLTSMGISGFNIEPELSRLKDGTEHELRADTHPSAIYINYNSIVPEQTEYLKSRVKIEISCLSMDEPVEAKELCSFISETVDGAENVNFRFSTVVPTRTFLEKIFLLHEEFQKEKPRYLRMSRHLYDIEKILHTDFADQALNDIELYRKIVLHRMVFNKINGIDYNSHDPHSLNLIPPQEILKDYELDYKNMLKNFIYGKNNLKFEELIENLRKLQDKIHKTQL